MYLFLACIDLLRAIFKERERRREEGRKAAHSVPKAPGVGGRRTFILVTSVLERQRQDHNKLATSLSYTSSRPVWLQR